MSGGGARGSGAWAGKQACVGWGGLGWGRGRGRGLVGGAGLGAREEDPGALGGGGRCFLDSRKLSEPLECGPGALPPAYIGHSITA